MRMLCSVGKASEYPQSTDARWQRPPDSSNFNETKQTQIGHHIRQPGLLGLVHFENSSMASSDRPSSSHCSAHREPGARPNRLQHPLFVHFSWPWPLEDVCAFPFPFTPPQVYFLPVYQQWPFHRLFLVGRLWYCFYIMFICIWDSSCAFYPVIIRWLYLFWWVSLGGTCSPKILSYFHVMLIWRCITEYIMILSLLEPFSFGFMIVGCSVTLFYTCRPHQGDTFEPTPPTLPAIGRLLYCLCYVFLCVCDSNCAFDPLWIRWLCPFWWVSSSTWNLILCYIFYCGRVT